MCCRRLRYVEESSRPSLQLHGEVLTSIRRQNLDVYQLSDVNVLSSSFLCRKMCKTVQERPPYEINKTSSLQGPIQVAYHVILTSLTRPKTAVQDRPHLDVYNMSRLKCHEYQTICSNLDKRARDGVRVKFARK